MGYAVIPYRVDWKRLTRVYGSRDHGLVQTIFTSQQIPGDGDYYDEDAEGAPNLRGALTAVLDGGPFDDDFPEIYVEALSLLCAHIGEHLDDLLLASPDTPLVGVAEQELKDLGVADRLSMFKLLYRGAPFPMPATDDRPTVGYMTPAEVASASRTYASVEHALTPAGRSVLAHVSAWLKEADRAREGLVCVYK